MADTYLDPVLGVLTRTKFEGTDFDTMWARWTAMFSDTDKQRFRKMWDSLDINCTICGEPWEDHYHPDFLCYKRGPFGTFGLKEGGHLSHIFGVHAERKEVPSE